MWIFLLTFPLTWTTKSVITQSVKKTSLVIIPVLALSPGAAGPSKKTATCCARTSADYGAWRLILHQIISGITHCFRKGVSPLSQSVFLYYMCDIFIFYLYIYFYFALTTSINISGARVTL